MPKIGTAPIASRYDGIVVGPFFDYTFETQPGIPVDGSNATARSLSPFTLRLLLPDALLVEAAATTSEDSVDLITAAARGSLSPSQLASRLENVTVINNPVLARESTLSRLSQQRDVAVATDIALQVRKILQVPPLTLLINPEDMNISYSNIQNYSTRTRYGYVFERWGEDQPTIAFSGRTGAFIAGASTAVNPLRNQTPSVSGMQFASKRDSAAWQNFVSLFHFYKSNGYIYNKVDGSEAHHFIGAIAIDYDQWTYVGHIESFEYSYDETQPHNVNWSMQFIVGRMYDNATTTFSVAPLQSPTPSPSNPGQKTSVLNPSDVILGAWSNTKPNQTEYSELPFELLGGVV